MRGCVSISTIACFAYVIQIVHIVPEIMNNVWNTFSGAH